VNEGAVKDGADWLPARAGFCGTPLSCRDGAEENERLGGCTARFKYDLQHQGIAGIIGSRDATRLAFQNDLISDGEGALRDRFIAAIRQVLASHPEVEAAILYGSRALGRHRPASDIDLTLIAPAISAAALARIESDRDDRLLPWMIDLSCLASIHHPALLAQIERAGVELYRRRDGSD